MNTGALVDAALLAHQVCVGGGYALAYGSHADGRATPTSGSDLDLLFVTPAPPNDDTRGGNGGESAVTVAELVTAVTALHHRHGLALDEEVEYRVKLFATPADVAHAVALGGFPFGTDGRLVVASVEVTTAFLNSLAFRLRLLFNALSTPHVFLGGDPRAHAVHVAAAERSVALLALDLLDHPTVTVEQAFLVLLDDTAGNVGEDFLGYRPVPHLLGVLHRGLATLAVEQIVVLLDGQHLRQDRGHRRAAVHALHATSDR